MDPLILALILTGPLVTLFITILLLVGARVRRVEKQSRGRNR
jgi:hypothetical protein